MIQEAYVSFETAKLLKEKGFDIPCCHYYENNQFINSSLLPGIWNIEEDLLSAPTHQMVLACLRTQKIFIEVGVSVTLNGEYEYSFRIFGKACKILYSCDRFFDTFEEATEDAIKYTFENLI